MAKKLKIVKQKIIKKQKNSFILQGIYSNFVGIKSTEKETILDFCFREPTPIDAPTRILILKRIILPVEVSQRLGKILIKSSNIIKKNVKKTKNRKK